MVTVAVLMAAPAFAQQPPLKMGTINPFSGPMAQYGTKVTRGFEMAAYRAKYKTGPIQTQSLKSYVGSQILFDAIQTAGSTEPQKALAQAAKTDKPVGSYVNGFGVKFEKNFQNQRAATTTVQWQNGKVVAVLPKTAVNPGVRLKNLARS